MDAIMNQMAAQWQTMNEAERQAFKGSLSNAQRDMLEATMVMSDGSSVSDESDYSSSVSEILNDGDSIAPYKYFF